MALQPTLVWDQHSDVHTSHDEEDAERLPDSQTAEDCIDSIGFLPHPCIVRDLLGSVVLS